MSIYKTKVTSKGQMTLPKAVREALNINTGDYLELEVQGRKLIVKTAPKQSEIMIMKNFAELQSKDTLTLQQLRDCFANRQISTVREIRELREEG